MARGQSESAANYVAFQDKRNAPLDEIRGLLWDGVPRLARWLTEVYGAPQDAYHAAVGRCWLVGMVARAHVPGCKFDNCPVLFGPEATKKSTSLEILGKQWTATINVSADKTDFLMVLQGRMVAELAELDSLMNRHTSIERVKTILSTREDLYRAPYARVPGTHKRTAIMVGTTNRVEWHKDDTGGRRFWPIECLREINNEWLRDNRDQLFAEAKVLYDLGVDNGGSWWLDGEAEAAQKERITTHYTADDPLVGWLEQWLDDARFWVGGNTQMIKAPDRDANENWECWGNVITTDRIMTQVLELPKDRQGRRESQRVSQAMRKLGWRNDQVRLMPSHTSARPRVWIKLAQDDKEQGQLFDKTQ
jgi:predicted P-loop ATPase